MANGNGPQANAVIFIAAGSTAPGPSAGVSINIDFNDPVEVVGGVASFAGVPFGTQTNAFAEFFPTTPGNVEFGGVYNLVELFAELNVTSGNVITGTITANPPSPLPITFSPFVPPGFESYTLPAGATTGSFTFPFSPSGPAADVHAEVRKKLGR